VNKHHLGRAVRTALELSDEERIKRVRSPRWIGYPTASAFWIALKTPNLSAKRVACRVCFWLVKLTMARP